ncbi:hypothetical protein WJX84_009292 [Apatococcus fuscideae]|uniref:BZIP domain-containing protein n=1 Tax=Apatococcus fuscideae TaxID=2026836 RepID=A0AAW1SQ39_9CHLO
MAGADLSGRAVLHPLDRLQCEKYLESFEELLWQMDQEEKASQQEALLYQSTDAQRRERNRVAQAASRQRKRLKLAADTEALQQSADRIRVLEQQIVALKTGRAMPVAEGSPHQPASFEALRTEQMTLQSGQTQFQGLMADLRHAQRDGHSRPAGIAQQASFSLMCNLNEQRHLPHHSRRSARRLCIETLRMHSGWKEALPMSLAGLYDALLSGDLDVPGRKFAAMCGESACLGAMLTEVSTPYLLSHMSQHMYHNHDPRAPRPQDNAPLMQLAGKIDRGQQLETKHLWDTYRLDIGPLVAEQASLQHDLQSSGGHQAVLSPFQIGHLSGAAYPFTLEWSELISSVAHRNDAPPGA